MRTVSFDIDGTLTDSGFDPRRILDITAKSSTVRTLRTLYGLGFTIRIVTARPERFRSQTEAWLKRNSIPYDKLVMRSSSDNRPDPVLRAEQSAGSILLFDDKPENCEHSPTKCVRV